MWENLDEIKDTLETAYAEKNWEMVLDCIRLLHELLSEGYEIDTDDDEVF